MDNLDNSILINRAIEVSEVLQELTAVMVGDTDWFTVYPRELRLAYEVGLCLSIVSMDGLSANKAMRYLKMLGPGNTRRPSAACEGDDLFPAEDYAEWAGDTADAPLEAFVYIGPPQATLFYERSLSSSRTNFAMAYEIGGYIADLLSYRCMWLFPRSIQCETVWNALDPTSGQYELWLDVRALPRVMTPHPSDLPSSALDLAVPYATANEIVARELLAPWAEIATLFRAGNMDRRELVTLLMERYDLPAVVAARYHNDLCALLRTRRVCPEQPGTLCSPPPMQIIHWGKEPLDDLDSLQGS